jgi:hypothetical protein
MVFYILQYVCIWYRQSNYVTTKFLVSLIIPLKKVEVD